MTLPTRDTLGSGGCRGFSTNVGAGSCASCHDTKAMVGVATRYPKFDESAQTLINLEGQINQCRTNRQHLPDLALESNGMLAPRQLHHPAVTVCPYRVHSRPSSALARTRQGLLFSGAVSSIWRVINATMNLGAKCCAAIRSVKGSPMAFLPRLEWQSLGSLHRRLQGL